MYSGILEAVSPHTQVDGFGRENDENPRPFSEILHFVSTGVCTAQGGLALQ